jgi:hypothetical protein
MLVCVAAPALRELQFCHFAEPTVLAALSSCPLLEHLAIGHAVGQWRALCAALAAPLAAMRSLQSLQLNFPPDTDPNDPLLPSTDVTWPLSSSLTSLVLDEFGVRDSPRIVASGLRTLKAPLSDAHLREVLESNKSLTELTYRAERHPVVDMTAETAALLLRCSQQTLLDIQHLRAPGFTLRDLGTSLPLLRRLEVWVAADARADDVALALPGLRQLEHCCVHGQQLVATEHKSDGKRLEPPLKALEKLSLWLANGSLSRLRAPSLRNLTLRGPGVSACVLPDLQWCAQITHLMLSELSWLEDAHALGALKRLPQLHAIKIHQCPRVTAMLLVDLVFVEARALIALAIQDCAGVSAAHLDPEVVAPALQGLPRLRALDLPMADATWAMLVKQFPGLRRY